MKSLVIVESPAKAKTLQKYLGKKFTIKASMGHVIDLPKSQFGIDPADSFKPKYIIIRGKGKILKELRDAAQKADRVYLATDPDREGEAISWHLANHLQLDPAHCQRIEFHEITKTAVEASLLNPRTIDLARVNAQQARRILDRIVGYGLSPLLWRKIRRGLSAGRVQSVAVRLICDREAEIKKFVTKEYWSIIAQFLTVRQDLFPAKLALVNQHKLEIKQETEAQELAARIKQHQYQVTKLKRKERHRYPAPPFTTSSLQQDAARKLGFSARKTMIIAQQLYEGLELGNTGSDGLITYMRTDSVRVAQEAQTAARAVITDRYGARFLPEQIPLYKTKTAGAQEAHEAIRPTQIDRLPEMVQPFLNRDQIRLYQLIWERFVASQMAPAVMDNVIADLQGGEFTFKASGSIIKFSGFLEVYQEGRDDQATTTEERLPELNQEESLQLKAVDLKQHFTQPPPRYTEATLIKTLEEKGIGRPSTYAPTIDTILKRNYVVLEEKRFQPTELGQAVVELLVRLFKEVIDYDFTAELEAKLDRIAAGELDWVKVLDDFYKPFNQDLEQAKTDTTRVELTVEVSEEQCPKCGKTMVYKYGRFGRFLACPGYPECKSTKAIRQLFGSCPKCGKGMVVERRSKKGRRFYGCDQYPQCDFVSWQRPHTTPCPTCGTICTLKGRGIAREVVCQREECDFTAKLREAGPAQ